jgi:hypothetical protein
MLRKFSPSDADCHATSRGGHTHAMEGRYYALVARSAATCQDRGTELVSTARTTK